MSLLYLNFGNSHKFIYSQTPQNKQTTTNKQTNKIHSFINSFKTTTEKISAELGTISINKQLNKKEENKWHQSISVKILIKTFIYIFIAGFKEFDIQYKLIFRTKIKLPIIIVFMSG